MGQLVCLGIKVVVLAMCSYQQYSYILILILFNQALLFQLLWQRQTLHFSIDLFIRLSQGAKPPLTKDLMKVLSKAREDELCGSSTPSDPSSWKWRLRALSASPQRVD